MNLIVAVDKNWGIGCKNELLVSIPADMRFFRKETTNKVVVMGRRTLESFPNGQPLKNRVNIVITKKHVEIPGAIVVHSVEEALEVVKDYSSGDVYVIGGASIYEQMLPHCDKAFVTKVDFSYAADSYFPNLDEKPEWILEEESEEETYHDLVYKFTKYVTNQNGF